MRCGDVDGSDNLQEPLRGVNLDLDPQHVSSRGPGTTTASLTETRQLLDGREAEILIVILSRCSVCRYLLLGSIELVEALQRKGWAANNSRKYGAESFVALMVDLNGFQRWIAGSD
jgi:hypothetical protein